MLIFSAEIAVVQLADIADIGMAVADSAADSAVAAAADIVGTAETSYLPLRRRARGAYTKMLIFSTLIQEC